MSTITSGIRFDVVRVGSNWALADSRAETRTFPSSSAAVSVAMDEARLLEAQGHSVEVHLWREGRDEKLPVLRPQAPAV
jgi:hypothetical protein